MTFRRGSKYGLNQQISQIFLNVRYSQFMFKIPNIRETQYMGFATDSLKSRISGVRFRRFVDIDQTTI